MSLILAIDPGKRGAAVIMDNGAPLDVLSFIHTPRWWHRLNEWCWKYRPSLCAFEDVNEFSGQGLSTTAVLIANREKALTAVDLTDIQIRMYRPLEWQERLGVPKFYHLDTKAKRRAARNKWLKEWALHEFPRQLTAYDTKLITTEGEKEKPDIWAGVGIGRACYLDEIAAPLGTR